MKRGFTLVELLAVIVIIAIISMVILPAVSTQIDDSKEDLYQVQVNQIEKAAKDYLLSNEGKEKRKEIQNDAKTVCISISELQDRDYLEKEKIQNPKDSSKTMNGGVRVSYQNNNYVFKYMELCIPSTEGQTIGKYITQYAVSEATGLSQVETTAKTDIDQSSNKKVMYYYRGDNPNNYIQFVTGTSSADKELWNIISIDETNQVMKLVRARDASKEVKGNISNNQQYLQNLYDNFTDVLKELVRQPNWQTGSVSTSSNTLSDVLTDESAQTINTVKVSLLSVSDYLNAYKDDACRTITVQSTCSNWLNNLAAEGTGYFLRNTVKNETNMTWSVTKAGLTKTETTKEQLIRPVIYLSTAIEFATDENSTNPVGSATNPYILKLYK